ncbi:hypothetical protein ACKVMT_05350 [Halobacteriales archaeon Cl-PHB]
MDSQKIAQSVAAHSTLFDHPHCSTSRETIVLDVQAGQYETARTRLQRLYAEYFHIEDSDWDFLEALAQVRRALTPKAILTHGEGENNCITTDLLKGHAPIRDLYQANIHQLIDAGLLRQPRICGEPRKRIIRKPYYVLTPEATDCIQAGTVGPGIGDLGESVTHAVGARLYGEFMKQRVRQEQDMDVSVEYYDDLILDDHDVDVAVRVYPPGESHNQRLYAVGEVKTVLSGDSEAVNTMYKMGAVDCEHKHWITPRRELVNEIVNVAALRGWYTLDPVPENLALETEPSSGIRSTNDRIGESMYVAEGLGMPISTPLTEVFTYEMLYRKLKQADPAMFDPPTVTSARL